MAITLHSPAWLARRAFIENETQRLLNTRGVGGWKIEFRHTIVFAGRCVHDLRVIAYSVPFMLYASDEQVKATIAHEVAHALLGPNFGHDAEWQELCVLLGGTGRAISEYPQALYTSKNFPWLGTCAHCGRKTASREAPQHLSACLDCKDKVSALERLYLWSHKDVAVPHEHMNEHYVRHYRECTAKALQAS